MAGEVAHRGSGGEDLRHVMEDAADLLASRHDPAVG
jgi:hypothetical protein